MTNKILDATALILKREYFATNAIAGELFEMCTTAIRKNTSSELLAEGKKSSETANYLVDLGFLDISKALFEHPDLRVDILNFLTELARTKGITLLAERIP